MYFVEQISLSFFLCDFLYLIFISVTLDPNILHSTLFSYLTKLLTWKIMFYTNTKHQLRSSNGLYFFVVYYVFSWQTDRKERLLRTHILF